MSQRPRILPVTGPYPRAAQSGQKVMQLFLRASFLLIVFSAIARIGPAFAHGDTTLPLFVAEGGEDAGDCLTESTPCRSIGYALSRAGKGSQLRIMEGTYDVENAEDVFHLISGVVDVSGGFKPGSTNGASERGVSLLEGVPPQYRDLLQGKGIQVIADSKGLSSAKQSRANEMLGLHQQLKSSIAAAPCSGGFAAGLPCNDVDLLSHVGFTDISATPTAGNDIWGFVDLNTGREYAIVGFNLGTAVFDVTDAENPLEVGFIDGQDAIWRDIKVYQFFDAAADRWNAYAFVTTDGSTDGLFIIDMTGLPHSIQRVSYPSDITRAHNVYATNTDFGTGIALTDDTPALIVAGATSNGNGQFRTYSLANPESPALVPGGLGTGYMHDAASMLIDDPRKDNQCVNAGDFCQLLLDFNENSFEIWDVTNAATPVQLSSTPYPNVGYVHSGWWSEDKQYVFVHDELDERNSGLPTTLRAFLISDLASPTLAGTWTGPTNAIDHNGFVRGNRYYMSNYTRGLTVLDITNPAAPVESGNLDTYPFDDPNDAIFNGAWGTYPFFHSGNIAISDIDSGFYMVADKTRDVPQGKFEFASASFAANEGQQAALTVQRTGGSVGAASVSVEVVNATTDSNDYSLSGKVLNWANGDAADKTISLSATNDGVGEAMERLIVRLINPTGGATLGNLNTTSAYIGDAGAASEVNFTASGAAVSERGFGTIVAVIKRSGSAVGAASVDISTAASATPGSDYTGGPPATVSWADGDGNSKTVVFSLLDDDVDEGDENIEMTLFNPVNVTIGASSSFNATIVNAAGTNLAPVAIAGASQTRVSGSQVTLNGNQSSDPNNDVLSFAWAQTGGPAVTLGNSNSAVATFTAPTLTSDALLQFRLTVADPGGLSSSSSTTVTVTQSATVPPAASSGGGTLGIIYLIGLGATWYRRLRTKS